MNLTSSTPGREYNYPFKLCKQTLVLSFFLKLLAGLVRINTNESLYGGQYDAGRYHSTGMEVAEQLWSGDFTLVAELTKLEGSWGTRYTEFYSGLVHTMTGPTIYGAFLVFSFLAFIGLYFYYRAFCIAFPHGNRKLYALLVFLLPSLIFWPNGLGKDALMALFIGLTAYGAARVFAGEYLKSLLPLGIGLLGALTVRPHMIGIAAVAMMAGLILGSRRFVSTSPVLYVVVMAVIFMGALYLVPLGAQYAGLSDTSLEALQGYIDQRQTSTGGGGSGFTFPSITDPTNFPEIAVTIIARPFPWEAHNLQAFIQSADGAFLILLMLWKIRRIGQAVRSISSNPYVTFILVYTVLFVIAFTTVANFGTLARERAMLLPFLLMLIAFLPAPKPRSPGATAANGRPATDRGPLAGPATG
jgi:hypothetical protein